MNKFETTRLSFPCMLVCVATLAVYSFGADEAPTPKPDCDCKTALKVAVIRGVNGAAAPRSTTDVTASGFSFTNSTININVGDTVKWTNTGGSHTVTDDGGAFESGNLNQGDTFSHTYNSAGSFPYHCQYHQGFGMVGTVNVTAVAGAPAITSSLTANATVGVQFSYTLTATGTPAPNLSFTNIPSGFSVVGATLSGTFNSGSPVTVGLHATNASGTDDKSLVITVAEAPAITSPLTATAMAGAPFSYTLTATGTPAPTLSFIGPPPGFNAAGATLSGTFTSGGQVVVGLRAANASGTVNMNLTINVSEAPAITSPLTATATAGTQFNYTLTATGTPAPSVSFTNLPSGASVVGPTLTCTFAVGGVVTVGLNATNNVGTDAKTLTINVSQVPAITSALTANAVVGTPFTYTLTADGVPAPAFSFTNVPNGLQTSNATLSGSFTAPGMFSIGLHAINSAGNDDKTLVVTVSQAPAITSPLTANAIVGVDFSYTLTAIGTPAPGLSFSNLPPASSVVGPTLTCNFSTPGTFNVDLHAANTVSTDDKTLVITVSQQTIVPVITSPLTASAVAGSSFTYTLVASGTPDPTLSFTGLPTGITASGATISGSFTAGGTFNIGLHAHNTQGDDDKVLVVTVTVPAVPPDITSAISATAIIGVNFSYTLTATGSPAPDFSFTNVPSGLTVLGAVLSGTFAATGQFSVGLHASNSAGIDDDILVITVGSIPAIASSLTATATTGTPFTYTLTASGVPAPALSYTNIPTGFTVNGAVLSGTFSAGGMVSVGVHAVNANGSADQTLQITVGAPPAITSPLTASVLAGSPFTYTLTATGVPSPTLSFINPPAGLTVTGATLSGTFSAGGVFTVGLRALNASGTADQTLQITVGAKPAITSALTATATVGTPFSYTLAATGFPTPSLSYDTVPGVQINGAVLTATFAVGGPVSIGIHATNANGADDRTLVIDVSAAPVITSPLTINATAGVPFTYTLTASGIPTPTLSFTNVPAELTASGATLSGKFATDGIFKAGLQATNSVSNVIKVLTINVAAATIPPPVITAPKITSPLTATAVAGAEFTYTITATGTDPVFFAVDGLPATLLFDDFDTISGIFTTAGTTTLTLGAGNEAGSDSQKLVVTVTAATEGSSGGWSGTLKGKLYSLNSGKAQSENGAVSAVFSQSGKNLAAHFTAGDKVFDMRGKIGGGNFWLLGVDPTLGVLALSGHLDKKSVSAKGTAIVVATGHAEEFTFTIANSAPVSKSRELAAPPCDCKPLSITITPAGGAGVRAASAVPIKDFSYGGALTVNVGDTVTWTNSDTAPHTATSDAPLFDTGTLTSGQSASFTFTKAGTFPYHCSIHSFMTGSVIVKDAGAPATPAAGGLSGKFSGKLSGKPFDQTGAGGKSVKGVVTMDLTDASGQLTGTVKIEGATFAVTGESGNSNLWLGGSDDTQVLVISGHVNKKGDSFTAAALLLKNTGCEELKLSLKKQ